MKTANSKKRRRLSESVKKRVAAAQSWRCAEFAQLLPATYQVDHIIPHCIGGSDDIRNLRALCVSCHATKTQCEGPRIQHHRTLVASSSTLPSSTVCWHCPRILSTYFTHECDHRGEF